MEQQIIQWIQEHSSFMVPLIFLICFLLLFALGWKGFRRHYREKVHYLNKTSKGTFSILETGMDPRSLLSLYPLCNDCE